MYETILETLLTESIDILPELISIIKVIHNNNISQNRHTISTLILKSGIVYNHNLHCITVLQ